MKARGLRLFAVGLATVVVAAVAAGISASPAAAHGCTPGFFKNKGAALFDQTDTFGDIGVTVAPYSSITLAAALNFGGGPTLEDAKNRLLRQSAAAYLNITLTGGDYSGPLLSDLIASLNFYLAQTDPVWRANILDYAGILDTANNAGCELD